MDTPVQNNTQRIIEQRQAAGAAAVPPPPLPPHGRAKPNAQEQQPHIHDKDCGPGFPCMGPLSPYQSPTIIPLDQVKQPDQTLYSLFPETSPQALHQQIHAYLHGDGTALNAQQAAALARGATFYLSQLDPRELEGSVAQIVHTLAHDKTSIKLSDEDAHALLSYEKASGRQSKPHTQSVTLDDLLTAPAVTGKLNRHLVEYFVENRRIEYDAEHRAFAFFTGFRHSQNQRRNRAENAGHTFNEYAELSENRELIGGVTRYARRMMNTPHAFTGDEEKSRVRTEVFSYLLPKLLEIASDEQVLASLSPESRDGIQALQTRLGLAVLHAMGPDHLAHVIDPDYYTVQTLAAPEGTLITKPKKMDDPKGYGTKYGIDVEVERQEAKTGNVRYMGHEYVVNGLHFHAGAPEHVLVADKDQANAAYNALSGGAVENPPAPGSVVGEMHIVTTRADGKGNLVLGAQIMLGQHNEALQHALDDFAKLKNGGRKDPNAPAADAPGINLFDFLPQGKIQADNIVYFGGLTTAPYTQGVRFVLPKEAKLEVSTEQLQALSEMAHLNVRAPQPMMGRNAVAAIGR